MKYAIAAGLALATLPSCATIVAAPQGPIPITSNVDGATYVTSEGMKGTTPSTYQPLEPHRPLTVTVSAPGYESQAKTVKPTISGWIGGNLLFGGIPGLIIDAINTETRRLSTDALFFDLEPIAATVETTEG